MTGAHRLEAVSARQEAAVPLGKFNDHDKSPPNWLLVRV